jgi:WXG100 family type VII secretion target
MSESLDAGAADAAHITVPADLSQAGAWLNDQAATIAEELHSLAVRLNPIRETWTGTAATYYEGLQGEWDAAAAGLFAPDGVLGQIAHAMHVAWGNYSQAEFDNTKSWQS